MECAYGLDFYDVYQDGLLHLGSLEFGCKCCICRGVERSLSSQARVQLAHTFTEKMARANQSMRAVSLETFTAAARWPLRMRPER